MFLGAVTLGFISHDLEIAYATMMRFARHGQAAAPEAGAVLANMEPLVLRPPLSIGSLDLPLLVRRQKVSPMIADSLSKSMRRP
jgi:hypothetical protein